MESYKNYSRFSTLIVTVITAISVIGIDEWKVILTPKYAFLAPVIVAVLSFVVAQYTEEKRVNRAEELVHDQYVIDDEDCEFEDAGC